MNNKEEKITISVNEEILYNRLYERTREFGRNQFVREITRMERENKQLKEDFQALRVTNISLNDLVNSCQKEIRNLQQERDKYKSIVEEVNNFLLEEKDRLARECSQIYEDELGKTRLVNEDIFNEVNKISDKIKELEEGVNNVKNEK